MVDGLLYSGHARFDVNVQTSVVVTYYPHPASTFPLIAALRRVARNRCPWSRRRSFQFHVRPSQLPPKFLFYWLTSRVHADQGHEVERIIEGYRVKYRPFPFLRQLPYSRGSGTSFSPKRGGTLILLLHDIGTVRSLAQGPCGSCWQFRERRGGGGIRCSFI